MDNSSQVWAIANKVGISQGLIAKALQPACRASGHFPLAVALLSVERGLFIFKLAMRAPHLLFPYFF